MSSVSDTHWTQSILRRLNARSGAVDTYVMRHLMLTTPGGCLPCYLPVLCAAKTLHHLSFSLYPSFVVSRGMYQ